jgi:hypothetical protein
MGQPNDQLCNSTIKHELHGYDAIDYYGVAPRREKRAIAPGEGPVVATSYTENSYEE